MKWSNKISIIAVLAGFLICAVRSPGHAALMTVNADNKFQVIEGFGGGFVFDVFPYNHPKKDELYDSIFNNARINIVRIANWYDPRLNNDVKEIPMMLDILAKWPHVKVMLTSWSPPPYLKSNDSYSGTGQASLKKNSDSLYMYEEYGEYWLQSIQWFRNHGVPVDWLSIQNEPGCPVDYEGCLLETAESPTLASYGRALDAVYEKISIGLNEPVLFIGPDVMGISHYLNRFLEADIDWNKIYAYCHHYYTGFYVEWMQEAAIRCAGKPAYQTEFCINEGSEWGGWFEHAQCIHNSLAIQGVSMYCLFALTYKPASTHCFFSLDTSGGDWYEARPTYYMFKHFSKSIHPGWRRIEATVDDPGIAIAAFSNELNDSMAVVAINAADGHRTLNCFLPGKTGEVHQTTETRKYDYQGAFNDSAAIDLDTRSITTIDLHKNNMGVETPLKRNASITTARIMEATAYPGKGVAARFIAPPGPVRLSLFDFKGNLRADWSCERQCNGGTYCCLLRGAFPSGMYAVILTSGTTVAGKNVALAR